MPFTLAHPAAVLPLLRRPWSAPALVAGAMAPDIPYSLAALGIPVGAQSWYAPLLNATTSHSPLGALAVSLPLGLALAALLIAAGAPLRAALPASTAPLRVPRRRPLPALAWIVLSCAVGIATHLLWDGLTHGDGWLAELAPGLREPAIGDLSWSRLLQHASSALGLGVLAWWLWAHRDRLPLAHHAREARRAALGVGALVAIAGVGAVAAAIPVVEAAGAIAGRDALETVLAAAAKGAGVAALLAGATALAAWWAARAARAVGRARRRP